MLSLGWLMDTGNRADVAAQLVDTAEVQVIWNQPSPSPILPN
jgi:hypothetical protein